MALNQKDETTREHMPTVLSGLNDQIQIALNANPTGKQLKDLRMLQMASKQLLQELTLTR